LQSWLSVQDQCIPRSRRDATWIAELGFGIGDELGGLEDIVGTPLGRPPGFWVLVIFGIAVLVRADWLIGQHFIAQ
jgi:hypothetical protein